MLNGCTTTCNLHLSGKEAQQAEMQTPTIPSHQNSTGAKGSGIVCGGRRGGGCENKDFENTVTLTAYLL